MILFLDIVLKINKVIIFKCHIISFKKIITKTFTSAANF